MSHRGGILPGSPLVYTLASVRFAPLAVLPQKIPEIQDGLRQFAPLFQPVQQRLPSPIPGVITGPTRDVWLIMTNDRTTGMQLGQDQALFFTSKYERFTGFRNFISHCMETLITCVRFINVTAASMRYIDHIRPSSGEKLAQYISPAFLTPAVGGFSPDGGLAQYMYQADHAKLVVKSLHSRHTWSTPADMIGLLMMVQGPESPFAPKPLGDQEMLLDMDAVREFPQATTQSLEEIMDSLHSMHQLANSFFRSESVCTDYAFTQWGESHA